MYCDLPEATDRDSLQNLPGAGYQHKVLYTSHHLFPLLYPLQYAESVERTVRRKVFILFF
jgi:hypothetical protein